MKPKMTLFKLTVPSSKRREFYVVSTDPTSAVETLLRTLNGSVSMKNSLSSYQPHDVTNIELMATCDYQTDTKRLVIDDRFDLSETKSDT